MKEEQDEARRKRIMAIKEAIEKGTYAIDAKAVAQKLLSAHLTEAWLRLTVIEGEETPGEETPGEETPPRKA